jgi:hypothetical protein
MIIRAFRRLVTLARYPCLSSLLDLPVHFWRIVTRIATLMGFIVWSALLIPTVACYAIILWCDRRIRKLVNWMGNLLE